MTTRQEVSQEICFLGSNKREPPLRIWEAHNKKNMRLRQAKKIMRNVQKYNGMLWIYGNGRVDKANDRMCRYYSAKDERFKLIRQISNVNPLLALKLLRGKV